MDKTFDAGAGYFLWSLFTGVILAFVYDIVRVTRRIKNTSDRAVNLEDILYVIFAGVMILFTAFYKNNGQLRWQGFIGAFFGIFAYCAVFKNHVVNLIVAMWEGLVKVMLLIVKVLLFPVRITYKILKKPFAVVCWHTGREIGKIKRIFKTWKTKKKIRDKCYKKKREKCFKTKENEGKNVG